tara:strand:+ start:1045 stop:1314 length:270 start_codon:yes stop_codon:yes gene_type:complete
MTRADYHREYYLNNRDKFSIYQSQYYYANRKRLLEYKRKKITCDVCGSIVSYASMRQHLASKKHNIALKCKPCLPDTITSRNTFKITFD